MILTTEWITELKNPIYSGLEPIIDSFDTDTFYISDGWGSSFPSMKLRKLSLTNGKELASVYIKNSIRCLYFETNGNRLMAVSDNRWFNLFRKNLELETIYDEKMSKYCDYISSDDAGKYLAMNHRAGTLFIFDSLNRSGKRKRIGSCGGIVPVGDSCFLILLPFEGKVVLFDLQKEKIIHEYQFPIFKEGRLSKSGKLYLRLGKQHLQDNTSSFIDPLDKMAIYDGLESKTRIEFHLPKKVEEFYLSDSEDKVFFSERDRLLEISIPSGHTSCIGVLEKGFHIIKVFAKERKMLIGKYEDSYKTVSLVNIGNGSL